MLLAPFTLAVLHMMGTACNVLVIKTERFNGMFLLSTAWNISHSSAILQGCLVFVERHSSQQKV